MPGSPAPLPSTRPVFLRATWFFSLPPYRCANRVMWNRSTKWKAWLPVTPRLLWRTVQSSMTAWWQETACHSTSFPMPAGSPVALVQVRWISSEACSPKCSSLPDIPSPQAVRFSGPGTHIVDAPLAAANRGDIEEHEAVQHRAFAAVADGPEEKTLGSVRHPEGNSHHSRKYECR